MELWSIIISTVLAIISTFALIVTVVQNKMVLKQNNKIIESANRPYLSFYLKKTYIKGICQNFLVIKNFGNSAAIIKSIESSVDLRRYYFLDNVDPIKKCVNVTILPKQNFIVPLNASVMSLDNLDNIKFIIKYTPIYSKTEICEEHLINYTFYRNNMSQLAPRNNRESIEDEMRIISDVLYEELLEEI